LIPADSASNPQLKSLNVNRNNLSQAVHDVHGGMSYADALKIVDLIFDTIKQRLIRGEKVVISSFGCFRIVTRKDRKGVNPQTGDAIIIRGRKAVVFKPSKYLKSL
jgi:nucleoid DNA-binding protein